MENLLRKVEDLSFTERNRDKMQAFVVMDWNGEILEIFPMII